MFGGHHVRMFLSGSRYPLWYPQYISGYEKVKITTTRQTSMTEMEPLTRRIVIFGFLLEISVRENLFQLFELWKKELLPHNILIVGALVENTPKNHG